MPHAQRLAGAGLLAVVLIAWQLAALRGLPSYLLAPLEIARHFAAALGSQELYEHAAASLLRALPGFAIGTPLGIALAPAAGLARSFDALVSPPRFPTDPV